MLAQSTRLPIPRVTKHSLAKGAVGNAPKPEKTHWESDSTPVFIQGEGRGKMFCFICLYTGKMAEASRLAGRELDRSSCSLTVEGSTHFRVA